MSEHDRASAAAVTAVLAVPGGQWATSVLRPETGARSMSRSSSLVTVNALILKRLALPDHAPRPAQPTPEKELA